MDDIYESESQGFYLDSTLPPWSGNDELEITFRPVTESEDVHHHWRLCRVDVVDVLKTLSEV